MASAFYSGAFSPAFYSTAPAVIGYAGSVSATGAESPPTPVVSWLYSTSVLTPSLGIPATVARDTTGLSFPSTGSQGVPVLAITVLATSLAGIVSLPPVGPLVVVPAPSGSASTATTSADIAVVGQAPSLCALAFLALPGLFQAITAEDLPPATWGFNPPCALVAGVPDSPALAQIALATGYELIGVVAITSPSSAVYSPPTGCVIVSGPSLVATTFNAPPASRIGGLVASLVLTPSLGLPITSASVSARPMKASVTHYGGWWTDLNSHPPTVTPEGKVINTWTKQGNHADAYSSSSTTANTWAKANHTSNEYTIGN